MNTQTVTTVLAAAASYNLTDLSTAKDELSIVDTSSDATLSQAITQVSRAVMRATQRTFAPEHLQDLINVRRNRSQIACGQIQLSRWPVLAMTSVIQTTQPGTTVTLVQDTDYRLDAATGQLFRLDPTTGRITAWEALPLAVKYSAGYGAAVTETQTVPASPYKVTVSKSSAFSCDQTVAYATGALLTPVAASPAVGQYAVAAGVYSFNAADTTKPLTFAYCTQSIPDDLVEICLRLVTGRFKSKDRDPALIQLDTVGVGTKRWWFGGAPGQRGGFPPDIADALDFYHAPIVA